MFGHIKQAAANYVRGGVDAAMKQQRLVRSTYRSGEEGRGGCSWEKLLCAGPLTAVARTGWRWAPAGMYTLQGVPVKKQIARYARRWRVDSYPSEL